MNRRHIIATGAALAATTALTALAEAAPDFKRPHPHNPYRHKNPLPFKRDHAPQPTPTPITRPAGPSHAESCTSGQVLKSFRYTAVLTDCAAESWEVWSDATGAKVADVVGLPAFVDKLLDWYDANGPVVIG